MKKLFQNVIFKSTFVLVCVALGCGLLLALVNLATKDIISEGEQRRIEESVKAIFPNLSKVESKNNDGNAFPESISNGYFVVLDSSDQVIGAVFTATGSNQHGRLNLTIGITVDGKIQKIVFVENGQTPGFKETVEANAALLDSVALDLIDSITLASGATRGTTLLISLVRDAGTAFNALPLVQKTFAESLFDTGTTRTLDSSFSSVGTTPYSITEKYIFKDAVGETVGVSYILKGFGEYHDDEYGNTVVEIVFNNNGVIVGGRLITSAIAAAETNQSDVFYSHTSGGYMNSAREYVESLIGKNLADALNVSFASGATNSKNAIKGSLNFLNDFLEGDE